MADKNRAKVPDDVRAQAVEMRLRGVKTKDIVSSIKERYQVELTESFVYSLPGKKRAPRAVPSVEASMKALADDTIEGLLKALDLVGDAVKKLHAAYHSVFKVMRLDMMLLQDRLTKTSLELAKVAEDRMKKIKADRVRELGDEEPDGHSGEGSEDEGSQG